MLNLKYYSFEGRLYKLLHKSEYARFWCSFNQSWLPCLVTYETLKKKGTKF